MRERQPFAIEAPYLNLLIVWWFANEPFGIYLMFRISVERVCRELPSSSFCIGTTCTRRRKFMIEVGYAIFAPKIEMSQLLR